MESFIAAIVARILPVSALLRTLRKSRNGEVGNEPNTAEETQVRVVVASQNFSETRAVRVSQEATPMTPSAATKAPTPSIETRG